MILAIVVLGGFGSQIGVVFAAILLIGLPELFRELQEYRMLAFGAAMVTIMVWRPGRASCPSRADPAPPCQAEGTIAMSDVPSVRAPEVRPLLTVEHLTMRFGGLVAIDDVSFDAADRQITAIIGPNGAGKTTVFNCLTGFYQPSVGRLALSHPHSEKLLERMEGYRHRHGSPRGADPFRISACFPA